MPFPVVRLNGRLRASASTAVLDARRRNFRWQPAPAGSTNRAMLGEGAIGEAWVFAIASGFVLAATVSLAARFPQWVVRGAVPVILLTVALTLGAIAVLVDLDGPNGPALRLQLDASTEPLLPAGDPAQHLYRSSVLDFGDDQVFVAAIECDEVFSVDCLSSMERVADPIARLDGVRSVRSLLDVTSFRYVVEEDWIEVRPFIEDIPTDPKVLAELRSRALADPVYRKTLISDDARSAALNISFRDMTDAEFIASDLDGIITRMLAAESERSGHAFSVAGRPHMKTRVYRGMVADLTVLIPLSILVVGLVLWIVTGGLRGVFLPLGGAIIACVWTFAAMAVLGRSLTLLTGLLGPTLLAIGSVYGVHVLARYEEEVVDGEAVDAVVLSALRHLTLPVMIAGLTTVIGFGALLVTDVPAVFELGAFSMFGVAVVTVLSLTFLPACLSKLSLRPRSDKPLDRTIDAGLARLAGWVQRRSALVLVVGGVLLAGSTWAIQHIVIDTDYLSYLDEKDPVRVDFEHVNRLLAGAIPVYVVLDGAAVGDFREPELLRAIEALQIKLETVDGVSRSLSFLDSLRTLNRAFHADDPAQEVVPDTRPGVTELLFMIPKSEMQRFSTVNHGRANLIVRTGEVGSAAVQRLTDDLQAQIDANPLPLGATAGITGNAILLARSADGIARSQPLTVGLAVITIFILISLGLRTFGIGAVAMVPNVVPVLVFFGLLGLGAAPLSLPTSLIGSVALGIAIDDTVHFLVRYRSERRDGASPEEAALRCTRFVGRPIVITSVMLFLGFMVVAFSDFATLREFGVLSALTMGICLLTDLVLLPALLIRTRV